MNLPTKEEINVHNSLDEIAACEHFLGKTIQEAELLFHENSSYYQEDLMWMGPIALNFYLDSVLGYLQSKEASGDDHFVDSLYKILEFRSEEESFSTIITKARRIIEYIVENYDKFEVDSRIYGDLPAKLEQFRRHLTERNGAA